MTAVLILLGVCIGLLAAIIIAVIATAYRPEVERTIKQSASRIKKKGKILEPENETLNAWIKELPDEHHTD